MLRKALYPLLSFIFALSDLLLLNMCMFICLHISNKYFGTTYNIVTYELMISIGIWTVSTRLFSLYNIYTLMNYKCVCRATWRSILFYIVLFQLYTLFKVDTAYSPIFLICFYATVIFAFLLSRLSYNYFEHLLSQHLDTSEGVSVFAIASIGGHWVQLLRLMPLFKLKDVTFVSTNADLQLNVGDHKFYVVPDANRNSVFNLIRCCFSIAWIIIMSKPKIIITTGAAPGLFGIFVGRLLGIKTVWIDSIANVEKLSLSGDIATRFADRVYTQWEHLSTPRIIFAGNILEG